MLTERIERLRKESIEAVNTLSAERALLITDFYAHHLNLSDPVSVQRAKAFDYIFSNKMLCYNEGELIIGERGPSPKATPTYPEITLHSINDLEVLHNRPKVSFRVSAKTRKLYKEKIIPFWNGKTHRDRLMQSMQPEWIGAYESGIFTEFQEQRAPGHTVLGKKIYTKGLSDFICEINEARSCLIGNAENYGISNSSQPARFQNYASGTKNTERHNYHYIKGRKTNKYLTTGDADLPDDYSEALAELAAMEIAARAMIGFAHRNAEFLRKLSEKELDLTRKNELEQLAMLCLKVPEHAPETLHEALQYYWFVHLGVISELNPWDSFNPGRLDQHLYPFYKADIEAGRHTPESARELIQSFWIKFNNHPSPPKIGVTAEESSTYTDFCLINLGGVKENGEDAVNPLTYVLLDVIEEMRLLQPSSMVQVSHKNLDAFIDRAIEIVQTGFGQPSLFNTDAIIQELLKQGKKLVDARNGGASGCVETGAFGKEAYFLTGYFNLVKVLELTLYNGKDPITGKQLGPETGAASNLNTFESLQEAFVKQLNYFIDLKIKGNQKIERLFVDHLPVPFLSLFIDDCIKNAKDYNSGGARYNTSYIQGVGLGSITDIFTALKFHVYDKETISLTTMLEVLASDFVGHESIRRALIYDTPKYGNDDDAADQHATWVFNQFYEAVNAKPNTRGGVHRINMLPTTSHVYFGSVVGATSDGRLARQPLSEGISPFQGMDTAGPTAVLKSAAKINHLKTGGTLLNQKFTPDFFRDGQSIRKIRYLVRTYFRMMGHHIQFNVVSADTLKDARQNPEKHRDLIVRVAGYSDYFNDLGKQLQDEIIRRTEQE